ncbi:MAG: VOC family protein [Pseudomonadota bacterium]
MSGEVRTCLWFHDAAEQAARWYVSLLPNSFIEGVFDGESGKPAAAIEFTLSGAPFTALNGAPSHAFTPATSISVTTINQQQTDQLWEALTTAGGQAGECGWLVDRYGLSWQVVPAVLHTLLASKDKAAAARAHAAMLGMSKIDIGRLQSAFDNN